MQTTLTLGLKSISHNYIVISNNTPNPLVLHELEVLTKFREPLTPMLS